MVEHRTIAMAQMHVPAAGRDAEILTPDALAFLGALHERFESRRQDLLAARRARQHRLDAGELPTFLEETAHIRASAWSIEPVPAGLADRRVEITGPVDRKMVINALNSGARMFMADFEDAHSPTWRNCIDGQVNLADAVRGTIAYMSPAGKSYVLGAQPATLLVRPRGWHLDEPALQVDEVAMSASLVDTGLYIFHNAAALLERGVGPWMYLPKLESHREARLWNDVFTYIEDMLGLERSTIRATVLIETICAAFEMDEILYELREHAAGLNAGRWDYIFSIIKKLRAHGRYVLPDRSQVTMAVPFMRSYCNLLVHTCHKRGAHAMGGMAAFIPNRHDVQVTDAALAAVRADKEREVADGFDGTWVAHPDLVSVAAEVFDAVLEDRPNQLDQLRNDVVCDESHEPSLTMALLDTLVEGGMITKAGLRANIRVGVLYLAAWLAGNGAVAIDNLMEDAATAEISRSQVWQWVHHGAQLDDGETVTPELVQHLLDDVVTSERQLLADDATLRMLDSAAELFAQVAIAPDFTEFLTLPAFDVLRANEAAGGNGHTQTHNQGGRR